MPPYFRYVSLHLATTNTSITRLISPQWDALVCIGRATYLPLEHPLAGGLTAIVIVTVTAQTQQGGTSRAAGDAAGLANIAHTVTTYCSSVILALPYIPLSWLWKVCRLSSFPCTLREFLSKADQ